MLPAVHAAVLSVDTQPAETAKTPSILVLGDSLSAGYGMSMEQSWVSLLEQRLVRHEDELGYRYNVINASISGDTTRGARARIDDILSRHQPAVAIVELGGNDGLRGIQPDEMKRNLAMIIEKLQNAGARVVLVPMKMPPNYGPAFTKKFESVYTELANEYDVVLSQFILEGIAQQRELMQEDNIHPTAAAQAKMLDNIWPVLKPILPVRQNVHQEEAEAI